MSEEDEQRGINWDKIHHMVVEKGNTCINGIKLKDIDWFLRDSNVSANIGQTDSETHDPMEPTDESTIKTPASPQMATTISNNNENISGKLKPTISPISEEPIVSEQPQQQQSAKPSMPTYSRRRSSAASLASASSNGSSASNGGSGFFSKLKHKLHKSGTDGNSPSSSPKSQPQMMGGGVDLFKKDYQMRLSRQTSPLNLSSSPVQGNNDEHSASVSRRSSQDSSDPRLDEYVRFYKQPDLRRSSLSRRNSSRSQNGLEGCLLNPLPPKKQSVSSESAPQSTTSKFTSLLRRKSISSGPSNPPNSGDLLERDSQSLHSYDSSGGSSTPRPETLPQFKGLKPLKRVAFHSLTFLIDPPQQIPSRNPRKGNVEILPGNVVRIHPLTEADKEAIERSQKGLGGGLVVGGTGALGLIRKDDKEDSDGDEYESPPEKEENPKHGDEDDEPDTAINQHAKLLGIDKPMLHHKARQGYTVPIKKMALDLMYTRCCHLREILPIPAIAKQIPKGSMAPLPLLQLRNPSPSMIEIQTFADFIRIAPIFCISLDGVSLSLEQFKILLSAMASKTQLEKLSLRNTPIDAEGWSLLCWFLSRNRVISKLDITQCPPLSVNVLKKKKKKPSKPSQDEDLVRMVYNKENRSDMDWSLFTATLIARGGIDELILTGCCINDIEVFDKLVSQAISLKTYRLGMAYNQIRPQQMRILVEKWVLTGKSRGLDLGYNDFLSPAYLHTLVDMTKNPRLSTLISKSNLAFISLNATNLRFSALFKDMFEKFMLEFPKIKYLDLSNNPKLFGSYSNGELVSDDTSSTPSSNSSVIEQQKSNQEAIFSYFTSKLPLFPNLVRLHLENNGLSSQCLTALSETIPFCKRLGYLSVLGNSLDVVAGTALVEGLKNSKTLITLECDYHLLPDLFKERIGLYTMRNMERVLKYPENGDEAINTQKVDPNEMSLTERLSQILSLKAEGKLDINSPEVKAFMERAKEDRKNLQATIQELLQMQWKNELNLEGKETLIRLLFIDSSLVRGLKLVDDSLVPDEQFNAANMIGFSLVEDESRKENDVRNLQDNHPDDPETRDLLDATSSLPYSRSHSLTSLNELNREEGSVLKLSKINKDAHLLDDLETFSGEELRQKILNVDLSELDQVIKFLNRMKIQGVSLKSVFNQASGYDTKNLLAEFHRRLEILKKEAGDAGEKPEPKAVLMGPTDSEIEQRAKEDDHTIQEAFDSVLKKFRPSHE